MRLPQVGVAPALWHSRNYAFPCPVHMRPVLPWSCALRPLGGSSFSLAQLVLHDSWYDSGMHSFRHPPTHSWWRAVSHAGVHLLE